MKFFYYFLILKLTKQVILLSNFLNFSAKVPQNSNANVNKGMLMLNFIKKQLYKGNTIHVAMVSKFS